MLDKSAPAVEETIGTVAGRWVQALDAALRAMALDLLPDNHPDVAPESLFLQITALREAEPAAN